MSIAVEAKRELEGYLLDAQIKVTIPAGTSGELLRDMTKTIAVVQFDVPSLGPLRVERKDLLIQDSVEAMVREMQTLLATQPVVASDVHRAGDNLLLRALQFLATPETEADITRLIELFRKLPKNY